jgi:hypothetical protein
MKNDIYKINGLETRDRRWHGINKRTWGSVGRRPGKRWKEYPEAVKGVHFPNQ